MQKKTLGLVGKKLQHSHSPILFKAFFKSSGLSGWKYKLFELASIDELPALLKKESGLLGFNVTVPYKQQVISYLEKLSEEATQIGAVNTVRIEKDGTLTGFNTDARALKQSLSEWLPQTPNAALILGTGGAAKAAAYAMAQIGTSYKYVSRTPVEGQLSYVDLNKAILDCHQLIIQATPLGMYPSVEDYPDIPYSRIGSQHYIYDLIYNPKETIFMKKCKEMGAEVKNGEEMLYLQATFAWKIWNA